MEISICARFLNRIKEKPDRRPAYAGEMAALRLFRAPRFKLRQGGERGGVVGLDKAVEGKACDVARRDGENLRRSRLFKMQHFGGAVGEIDGTLRGGQNPVSTRPSGRG